MPLGTAQQVVEGGNLAQYFIAQQRQIFSSLALRSLLYRREALAQQARLRTALVEQGKDDKHSQRDDHKHGDGDDDEH